VPTAVANGGLNVTDITVQPHGDYRARESQERYLEADSAWPTTAWPAASRAVSTRNGEQLT
jgi:hypothetical protein